MRLKVFERDGFKCRRCFRDTETLHVHHLVYSGGNPWESKMEDMETLCWKCHEWREQFDRLVGRKTKTSTHTCFMFVRLAVLWETDGNDQDAAELETIARCELRAWEILSEIGKSASTAIPSSPPAA